MCMYATALLKAKMFKGICNLFFTLFGVWVKFRVKSDIFFKITCVSFTSFICNSCTY